MGEETIINQMGLLLTQVRYARRALEDLERNVANYGGISFLQRVAPEEALGAPPLMQGALKVHVVNIGDLTYGGPGFFESLLGGIGRFFGGFFGGIGGGFFASFRLPGMIADVARIAEAVDRLVARTGFRFDDSGDESDAPASSALPAFTDVLLGFAALFRAAAGDTGSGTEVTPQQSAALEHLQRLMRPVYALLEATSRVVDGLILLFPIATGALAWMIDQIDALKLAFVEFLQFMLRNVLLLRGLVLVTLSDTLAVAARLGRGVLGIVGTLAGNILDRLFQSFAQVIAVALDTLRFVADGLQRTIDPLLDWAVARVFHALNALGRTAVFRVVYHVVDILPNILPALVRLVHGTGLNTFERRRLGRISGSLPPLRAVPPRAARRGPRAPNIGALLMPTTELTELEQNYRDLGTGLRNTATYFTDQARGALARTGALLEREGFEGRLRERMGAVSRQAAELAGALDPAVDMARRAERQGTPMDAIARAYEQWLGGGGLAELLGAVNRHFLDRPDATGSFLRQARGVIDALNNLLRGDPPELRRLVDELALARARATVEIAEVVVEVETGAARRRTEAAGLLPEPALIDRVVEALRDRTERGARPGFDPFGFA